ncbi:type IIL restriction-modification enzyme MmeI [Blastomonas sp. AAP25]|uniref:type IIL restriction-modification enzyme MmeI n=1 Tax=Blastomonas sp. AAP25 TaxID=1523416 RepID=UPI0018D111C1|nr:type IIL restriction-modification enzyme MmeI [Blastomonas sp. AAP25]
MTTLFDYPDKAVAPTELRVTRISPYLVEGPPLSVQKSRQPLTPRPLIQKGSEATDFGHLTLTVQEANAMKEAPGFRSEWLRVFIGGDEYINGGMRFCLWLLGANPDDLRACPEVIQRTKAVAEARSASDKPRTRLWSKYPSLFSENRQPKARYLLVPKVSSQRREYIPIGYCDPEIIVSGSAQAIENADLLTFAILCSNIHMAWMRAVGGRTKSDYQYSNSLVYNTFPWPDATPAQRAKVEALAQAVLDARAAHTTCSLADLYDPDTMPADLRRAHTALDRAVDRLYRAAPFETDRDRVEHLFGRYEALVNPLERLGAAKNRRVARKAEARG